MVAREPADSQAAVPDDAGLGPPLLGALLRMPIDAIRERLLQDLHAAGFDDLVPAHLVVLRYPGPHRRRPLDVAAQSGMSKQGVNYLLGQLERLGYLERRVDPDDQRARRIHLTARGHAAMRAIRAGVTAMEDELAAALGREDVERLRALLVRVGAVVSA